MVPKVKPVLKVKKGEDTPLEQMTFTWAELPPIAQMALKQARDWKLVQLGLEENKKVK
jgi:hypothetical protein